MEDWNKQAQDICSKASASGSITRSEVNMLRRTFTLLSSATLKTVQKVLSGAVSSIVEDGDGVFDKRGRRIR